LSSPSFRPSSHRSNHFSSSLSSCCSYQTQAWLPFSPGSSSSTSSSALLPRPPWEPHLWSSPSLPKTP
jgi:hypothetical protein